VGVHGISGPFPRLSPRRGRAPWTVTVDGDGSAALVVRVWLEDGAGSFRGRLTSIDTSPAAAGAGVATVATVALVSSPRDAVEAVRAWLAAFLGDAANPIDGDE
jgi:hypothetical protein